MESILIIVLFIAIAESVYIGYKIGKHKPVKEMTEEDKRKLEKSKRTIDGYNNIMNYNKEIAYKKKVIK